jgi:hypothetical protein
MKIPYMCKSILHLLHYWKSMYFISEFKYIIPFILHSKHELGCRCCIKKLKFLSSVCASTERSQTKATPNYESCATHDDSVKVEVWIHLKYVINCELVWMWLCHQLNISMLHYIVLNYIETIKDSSHCILIWLYCYCRLIKDINFNQYEYWYKVLKVITMTDYCATIETISMNNDNYLDYLSLINLILLMIPQHTLNWNMIHMN